MSNRPTSTIPATAAVVNPYAKSRKRPRPEPATQKQQQQQQQNAKNTIRTLRTTNNVASQSNQESKKNNNNNGGNTASALIISASDKAGMEGIDRSQIDAIILRESGNSLYMQQQRKQDEKVNRKIQQLLQIKQQQSSSAVPRLSPELERQLQDYQSRELPHRSTRVVVDMDMFYMACELLSQPHLQNVPACVGGGMILTSNYEARKYGVRSAMAGYIGDKLVQELSSNPQQSLVHIPANFTLYKEKSKQVVQVLKEYDPHLKSYSLDEAYLELGPYLAIYLTTKQQQQAQAQPPKSRDELHESIRDTLLQPSTSSPKHKQQQYLPILQSSFSLEACEDALMTIVQDMRTRVKHRTGGLTCSAGIAPNHGLAKIASDRNKPNGQCFVHPFRVLDFLHPLPVRKVPGIGRVTEKLLQQVCDIATVQDLYQQRGWIPKLFPPATTNYLLKASVGCLGSSTSSNEDEDEEEEGQKGISRERTFAPEHNWNVLLQKFESIATMLSQDMVQKQVLAHTITVKVKLKTFDVWSRAKTLDRNVYIRAPEEIFSVAQQLLVQVRTEVVAKGQQQKISTLFCCRLLGIRCSSLLHETALVQQKPMDKFLTNHQHNSSAINCRRPLPKDNVQRATPLIKKGNHSNYNTTSSVAKTESKEVSGTTTTSSSSSEAGATTTTTTTKEPQQERNLCPLCSLEIVGDNIILNRHLDTCLNGSTVRQVIKEVSSSLPSSSSTTTTATKNEKKGHRRLTDFW